MKKIFTLLVLSSSAILGFGQSLILLDDTNTPISNTTINVDIVPSASNTKEILVSNSSSVTKSYKVRRTLYSITASDSTQFCWGGLCYQYSSNVSSLSLSINASDTVDFVENGFHAIFNAGPSNVMRSVHYVIYDVANTSDSTGVTIHYNVPQGVNEQFKSSGTISNAFPNPSSSFVSMKYDLNEYAQSAKIIVYDMLGKKVKEIELTDKQGIAKLNVSEMNAGIYFYTFTVDGKAVATKKLVVSAK